MRRTHVGSAYANATITIAALAVVIALALIVAPRAYAGGSSGPDCLLTNTGGSLDDFLCGTPGADVMTGGAGNDTMLGRGGNDTMNGQTGTDSLTGEVGNDILTGGSGSGDRLSGSSGNDQLRARDGELDSIVLPRASLCGTGTDSFDMDLLDFATTASLILLGPAGCESVTVGAVNEGRNVAISRRTPKIKDSGKVPVRLSCPAELTTPCAGTLRLGRSENSQGSPKAYSLDPGGSEKVKARLSRRDRHKLSRSGEITVHSTSIEQGEFGDKTTVQTLELTAQRKRHT